MKLLLLAADLLPGVCMLGAGAGFVLYGIALP